MVVVWEGGGLDVVEERGWGLGETRGRRQVVGYGLINGCNRDI